MEMIIENATVTTHNKNNKQKQNIQFDKTYPCGPQGMLFANSPSVFAIALFCSRTTTLTKKAGN